jgi:hypothetical protein
MNRITKGLAYPIRSGADAHFDMIYDTSADDHFDMIYDTSADDHFDMILSDSQPKKPVRVRNETENWLYNAKCENYERVLGMVQRRTPYNKRFTLPEDQIVSYFHSFLSEHFIKKNQLKTEIDKGKRIKPSVVYEWFLQYVVREKYKEGADALQRSRGARTQSEVTKVKAYASKESNTDYVPVHHIQNLESQGWQIAQVVSKTDADTGVSVGEPDYFVHEDENHSLEEKSTNAYMRSLLLDRFGEAKVDMYYSLWLELRYTEYESKKKWASARSVSYKVLTSQITQIREVFIENQADFGH